MDASTGPPFVVPFFRRGCRIAPLPGSGGKHQILIEQHARNGGAVQVERHWRSVPSTYPDDAPVIYPGLGTNITERQGFAPPTNAEPVESFGGKQS